MPGTARHDDCGSSKVDIDRGLIAKAVAACETNPCITQSDHQVNIHSGRTAKKDVEKDPRTRVEAIGTRHLKILLHRR